MIYKTKKKREREREREKRKINLKRVSRSSLLVTESAPVEAVGLVSPDVFLVGGACACVLIDGAGSHLSEEQCSVQ